MAHSRFRGSWGSRVEGIQIFVMEFNKIHYVIIKNYLKNKIQFSFLFTQLLNYFSRG